MAVDEAGDESRYVGLAPLPSRLEGFQIDFLHCVGRPFVMTLKVVD
jgi:hypothetical protein